MLNRSLCRNAQGVSFPTQYFPTKQLTTMAFKMIVAFSGILLVSDPYDHIFEELRKQNRASILMSVR